MKKGNIKLFKDRWLLADMLALRTQGWSFTSLSILFSCDRTSIENQCKKYMAQPEEQVYTIERITVRVLKPLVADKWKIVAGERINRGMNYADYLKKIPPRVHIPIERKGEKVII